MKRTNNTVSGGDIASIALGVVTIGFVAASFAASAKRAAEMDARHKCNMALMDAEHQLRMQRLHHNAEQFQKQCDEDSRKFSEKVAEHSAEVEKIVKRALHKEDISGAEDATIVG